jgi:hypothetical protein
VAWTSVPALRAYTTACAASVKCKMNLEDIQITEAWNEAAKDLGFECVSPYKVKLENGETAEYIALIREFGSQNGTLVCSESSCPEGYAEEDKYFVSILSHHCYFPYNRDNYVETLRDWGWHGEAYRKPLWL